MYLVSPNWNSWYRLAKPVHLMCLQQGKHRDSLFCAPPDCTVMQSAALGRYLIDIYPFNLLFLLFDH